MSIIKIKDICLCTGLTMDNNENRAAYDYLKQNNVNFRQLAYWEPTQHNDIWSSLKTWDPTKKIDKFPILHYIEIDDQFNTKPVIHVGLDEIKNSNVVALSKL